MRLFITAILATARVVSCQTTITLTPSSLLQIIDGFGVSQAFGRASQFQALTNLTARQLGLDYLFSTSIGAGLTIIRNRVGSGGSGDSIEPVSPGTNVSTPSYVWDGVDSGQVWFSQSAMTYGVKTIYADAWSAPGFMKTTGTDINGGYLCGVTGEVCTYDWRQAYANFLLQYVKFYAQTGIPVTHIGFLNEPELVTSYSSMISTGAQSASFIPILYDTFHAGGFGNVSLTCCDAEGWSSQQTMTAAIIAAGAESYLGVITSHSYTSNPTSPMVTSLKSWQTEAADLNDAFCTTWYSSGGACEGLTWASKISTGMVAANLSAYLYWEGLEPNATTSSSHLIDTDGTNVTPSGRLWALAMWSRFVRPGAHRITSSGTITGVAYGAFKNVDGTIAVVFTNTASTAQSVVVTFSGFAAASASAWLTDNSHTVASYPISVSEGSVSVSVLAYSVVTVKLSGSVVVVSSASSKSSSTSTTLKTTTSSTTTKSSTGSVVSTSSSSRSSSATVTVTSTGAGATATQSHWGQCGGTSWSGPTLCATPYTCSTQNVWYGQCL